MSKIIIDAEHLKSWVLLISQDAQSELDNEQDATYLPAYNYGRLDVCEDLLEFIEVNIILAEKVK